MPWPACAEPVLEVAADAVQHLELEAVGGDALAADELARVRDDRLVVGGEARDSSRAQQPLHQPDVVPVHVGLVGKGHRRRLEVGALAEPDPGLASR